MAQTVEVPDAVARQDARARLDVSVARRRLEVSAAEFEEPCSSSDRRTAQGQGRRQHHPVHRRDRTPSSARAPALKAAIDAAAILKPAAGTRRTPGHRRDDARTSTASTSRRTPRFPVVSRRSWSRSPPSSSPSRSSMASKTITRRITACTSPMRLSRRPSKLSNRYVQDRFLPDKAIDLIDEAGARMRISNMSVPEDVAKVSDKLKKLRAQKEEEVRHQNFEALLRTCAIRRRSSSASERSSRRSWREEARAERRHRRHRPDRRRRRRSRPAFPSEP